MTITKNHKDRRKYIRYVLQAEGRFVLESGSSYVGLVENISIGGYFMLIDGPPNESCIDEHGIATFSAYVEDAKLTVEAFGRIVRTTPNGIGVFFESMDTENKKRLHLIVKQFHKLI